MTFKGRRRTLGAIALIAMVAVAAAAIALIGGRIGGKSAAAERGERHSELWEQRQQRVGGESAAGFANMERIRSRTAPALTVNPAAVTAAQAQAGALPLVGPAWSEITNVPYNSDAKGFADPVWSNSGGGAGNVGGLVRGIAIKPGLIFVSSDSGGVWRSSDGGAHWTPVGDSLPTLSTGDIEVNPADGSLWVGTGAPDSYVGQGVWRSTDNGGHWTRVGGTELAGTVTGKIAFDGHGMAIVANSQGVFRHASTTTTGAWTRSTITPTPTPWPYGLVFANDIQIRPGTNGKEIVASIAWRGGSPYDGFYLSTDGGASFNRLAVTGSINDHDIRRSSFAYSSDGKKLYALVQSASLYDTARMQGNTTLNGIYVSSTGNAVGPWSKVAEYRKLQNADSAFQSRPYAKGYSPGVQAWYNQFIKVDPSDPNHVYLGLEEVYETTDGGNHWHTIGPYWNFSLPCYSGGPDNCPPTTHPDQHSIAIANGTVYVGNDGGLYSRPLHNATGWANLNSGMNTLLYYYAGSGKVAGGDAVWGGLQDNGTSLLLPGASEQVSPFGGDGGDVLIDPNNGNRAVVEYTDLTMALTTNGGRSDGTTLAFTEMSPSCFATDPPAACDPNPRFIAPYTADVTNINHWVAGGEFVWDNGGKGWDTRCNSSGCDWTKAYDTGAGNSVTALAVNGSTTYAGWCGPCNPSVSDVSSGFGSGIATNYGGTWHALTGTGLPNRYVNSLVVDPANAAHVFAIYSGFSRKWIPTAGTGHVFESKNGGATWTDISGNLPDAPADDLVMAHGKLVVATDVGVFEAAAGAGTATSWSRMGGNLPNAFVTDLSMSGDGRSIVAATYGRGLWRIATP